MEHFLCIDNQRSAQSKYIVNHFTKILKEFSTIIELGTFTGVFTKWLSKNISDDCKIITYDINPNYREVGELKNTSFRIADVLDPSTIFEIKTLIEFGGKVLFLCDGGDKETEFKIYSKFLKHGDVIMLHDYEHDEKEYESIKNTIGWTTVSESHFKNLERYLCELQLIPYMYDDFKEVLWGSFLKNKQNEISLSITTCKRIDLFKKTINSFCEKCVDIHLISKIFHYDDSSTYEDRVEMSKLLKSSFPKSKIIEKKFESSDFSNSKRHCHIMNEWLYDIKENCDYVFHLEDDWEFNKSFEIKELIEFIKSKNDVAYVGVSQDIRNFPDQFEVEKTEKFWKWFYDKDRKLLENLFLDEKIMKKSKMDGFWCYYINWPYFGFRPGLWDCNKLKTIKTMNCNFEMSFELDFALNLSENYVSFYLNESVCDHIGDGVSSYELNNSQR